MFDGTVESLTELAGDLPVQRETRIATLLAEYEQTLETATPDASLLHDAYQSFQQCLQRQAMDGELAHLAVAFSSHLGNWMETAHMLARYRQERLPVYEEAWAWWHSVDSLALAGAASVTIEEQRTLIQWAREMLPPTHRLFTVADATQAFVWVDQNKGAEWVMHSQSLLEQTPVEPASRFDRFLALRSLFTVALRLQERTHAERVLVQVEAIAREDPGWERNAEICLETVALQLALANMLQDRSRLVEWGEQAKVQYFQFAARWEHLTVLQRCCLRRLAHNLGAELYEAQCYDLACPLFEQAVRLGATTPYTYLWLAGCVWALWKDEHAVFALLQQARVRDDATTFQAKLAAHRELHGFVFEDAVETHRSRAE